MALSRIKLFKLDLFGMKHDTQHYLVYIFVIKWLELKTIVICSKLRAKLRFKCFIWIFGTFSHKVAQPWFIWHETWHIRLLGINYCVKMVIIENNSHMLILRAKLRFDIF